MSEPSWIGRARTFQLHARRKSGESKIGVVKTYPVLGEFEGALVAADLEQLLNAAFIGGVAHHVPHDGTHKLNLLAGDLISYMNAKQKPEDRVDQHTRGRHDSSRLEEARNGTARKDQCGDSP